MKSDFPKIRVVSAPVSWGAMEETDPNVCRRLQKSSKRSRPPDMRGPSSAEPSCEGLEFNVKE